MHQVDLLLRYFHYWFTSGNAHGLHSPFVFNLYTQVICNRVQHFQYQAIEHERQRLLHDQRVLEVTDFGAGSKVSGTRKRSISSLAMHAAKPAKYGQLLFRLVQFFQPKTVLELGTSLGLTTSYLASARPQSKVVTFEGCPETARAARETLQRLHLPNVEVVEGNLDATLERALQQTEQLDFVFFDGNHRLEPTLRYFRQCLGKAHLNSVFVFDDIYWSAEMREAWRQIKAQPQVMLTVDLFFVGLVFFRTNQPKQHFKLRF